jgi:RNA recognition motif. (a.k.a. RRM, RBD, or RNP domain)
MAFVDLAEKTDDDVRALFEPYGKVELVNIPRNKATGDPRGFAFVDMESSDDLDAAIAGLDGASFGSRNIRVSKSVPKGEGDKQAPSATVRKSEVMEGATKLYIGNIPFGTFESVHRRLLLSGSSSARRSQVHVGSPLSFLFSFFQRRRWRKSRLTIKRTGRCWKPTFRWIATRGRAGVLRSLP